MSFTEPDASALVNRQPWEGPLGTTGWIQPHPATRADVAHLLMYSPDEGTEQQMRTLATLMGLQRADKRRTVQVPPDDTHLRIGGGRLTVHSGRALRVSRSIDGEWAELATSTHTAVLTMGLRTYHPHTTLNAYLARPRQLYVGVVRVLAA